MTCLTCGTDVSSLATECPACSSSLNAALATIVQQAGEDLGATIHASARTVYDATTVGGGATPAPAQQPDTGPLRPGQPFGSRYHVIRALGIGGMGAVYQAWDTELGEAVAIKVIKPEAMANRAAVIELEKRFKRELLLARQVTHKNVVRIHDLGEIDGIKYITMSYVEGTDLATLLRKEGTLGVERTLKIIRSVLAGLTAAHSAGVVHRDLKPANIMIRSNDGEALIMDFGIARSTGGAQEVTEAVAAAVPVDLRFATTRWAAEATMAGAVVGTIQYMAPEQARGQDVDQRADLYSLGLIMYDMLVGRHRSTQAKSALAELQTRMEHAPTPVRQIASAVPASFDAIVSKCLEPERDKRYASSEALASALARLDEKGQLLPIRRVVGIPMMAAIVVLLLAAAGGTVYYQRQFIPPPVHDPVSVIIADLENQTNDPSFDRTLEPMLKRALEGASFITAYDRNGIRGLGAPPVDRLSKTAAHELAVQQGLGVVLSGVINQQGAGYRISLTATQTVPDTVLATEQATAARQDQVLDIATRLVTRIRNALGDEASESAQQFAMASVSATSLDVVRYYANAQEAQSRNRFEDARTNAAKAVELDPNFGIGYLILAVASRNLGRLDDNQRYLTQALTHLDGMTERERFQTRGYSYWSSGDYEQCIKEYSDLIARYPGDVGGRNQLALCLSNQREMKRAMEEIREIVKILPSHALFRDNLALYANYASDFTTAEEEAKNVKGPDVYASLALAFAHTGQGRFADARTTYQEMREMGPQGGSFAASGLGDLAAVEGRFAEAVDILRQGAADDLRAKNTDSAAAKYAAIAYSELSRGRKREAIAAADEAVKLGTAVKIRFLAARAYIEAGAIPRARPLMEALSKEFNAEPRAHAKILEGDIALSAGDARGAMTLLREANDLFDTWIGLFDLGRASLAAQAFTQADSSFDVCLNARRGEALALFVDEEPTYAFLPQAYYYQGLVRQGLNSAGAAESFKQYLALRGSSREDPLVAQARAKASE